MRPSALPLSVMGLAVSCVLLAPQSAAAAPGRWSARSGAAAVKHRNPYHIYSTTQYTLESATAIQHNDTWYNDPGHCTNIPLNPNNNTLTCFQKAGSGQNTTSAGTVLADYGSFTSHYYPVNHPIEGADAYFCYQEYFVACPACEPYLTADGTGCTADYTAYVSPATTSLESGCPAFSGYNVTTSQFAAGVPTAGQLTALLAACAAANTTAPATTAPATTAPATSSAVTTAPVTSAAPAPSTGTSTSTGPDSSSVVVVVDNLGSSPSGVPTTVVSSVTVGGLSVSITFSQPTSATASVTVTVGNVPVTFTLPNIPTAQLAVTPVYSTLTLDYALTTDVNSFKTELLVEILALLGLPSNSTQVQVQSIVVNGQTYNLNAARHSLKKFQTLARALDSSSNSVQANLAFMPATSGNSNVPPAYLYGLLNAMTQNPQFASSAHLSILASATGLSAVTTTNPATAGSSSSDHTARNLGLGLGLGLGGGLIALAGVGIYLKKRQQNNQQQQVEAKADEKNHALNHQQSDTVMVLPQPSPSMALQPETSPTQVDVQA